jgi:beta-galactosidase
MKSILIKLAVLSCATVALAQAPLPAEIENPECLGINKEPAHATLMPYANLKEALAAKRSDSAFCRSLNGNWKFNYVPHPDQRPVNFYKTDFDDSAWKEIPVPSCWQLLGYGTPYYRNFGYTFKKDWPHVMSEPPKSFTAYNERNPVGSYRREFEVPTAWDGRQTFITFDGVDSAFFLWINGEKVGYSVNSRNAAEFDITRFLKPGKKNLVALEVYRYCAGSYLEDQDMWRLSGIFRNVTLWSAPQVHVRDFFIKTDLDAQYQNATVEVTAKVKNYGDKAGKPHLIGVSLFDKNGKLVAEAAASMLTGELASGQEQTVNVKFPVIAPAKWTAETPNLYTITMTVGEKGESGVVYDRVASEFLSARVGFRKIEIKDRVFTVNGVPVKLKGANRHENWPDTGHTVSEELMIRDLEVLKQGNCNHVRTCHYSDDPRWYELCDEWGIYLVAEANVESHGNDGRFDNEPRMKAAIIDRNVANVENFKNHPSVVIWSLGNECGGRGSNFIAALNAIKAIDSSRPTHYERFGIGDGNPADLDSQMYTHPNSLPGIANDPKLTKPFYLCEYAHAMFNSMGSIGDYNDMFDQYPSLMGGAIWEWEDQGIWNRRNPQHEILAYGGGFKEMPNDHYFIHKGVVFSDRSPKPHYPEMKRVYQWISIKADDLAAGQVKIQNRYAFINLDGFNGLWTLSEDGTVIDQGKLEKLTLAPGAEQVVTVPFKKFQPKAGAAYHLRVAFTLAQDERWAKKGYEIAAEQFQLPIKVEAQPLATDKLPGLKLNDAQTEITVTGQGFEVVFDKTTGTISQLVRDQKSLLIPGGGPRLHLWRAAHRNDDMWAYKDWHNYGFDKLGWSVVSISAKQVAPSVVRVESVVRGEGLKGFTVTHSANFTVYGDGSIAVDNAVTPSKNRIPLARLGVRLELDKQLDQFAFLGRGPMENYSDRKRGSDIGLYSSSVREQMTPYAKPMECGNHEDVRWAALTGKGLPTLLAQAEDKDLQVSALPYTDEVMFPVEYTIDLPPSKSTVLTVAARTLGVGSAGCGPQPLDPYMVRSGPETFSYVLRLLPAGQKNLAAAARQSLPQDRVKPALEKLDAAKSGLKGKVTSASSFEPGEGELEHAVDGDEQTYWHSRWSGGASQPPHFLVIDYGQPLNIEGVRYVARMDSENGHVKDYEIYLSGDGQEWGKPAAKGSFRGDASDEVVQLRKIIRARYVKFVALNEQNGQPFASVAELEAIEAVK